MIRFIYWDYKETRSFVCVIYTENGVGIADVIPEISVIILNSEVTKWFYVTYFRVDSIYCVYTLPNWLECHWCSNTAYWQANDKVTRGPPEDAPR